AHVLSRHLDGGERAIHLELRKRSCVPARTLDADLHGVIERTLTAVEIDPVRILVAHEIVGRLHRIQGPGCHLEGLAQGARLGEAPGRVPLRTWTGGDEAHELAVRCRELAEATDHATC